MNIARTRKLITNESVGLTIAELEKEFAASHSGETYFVDGNRSDDSGDGTTWATAYKYLSTALAASHAQISLSANRAWAKRNRIYCIGDNLDENLVLGAEKTDVIGVGTSTSFDKCILIGNHAPRTTNTYGMRFFNMHFDSDTAGILWSLTAISTGIKFINCTFGGRDAAQTSAILGTACAWIEVAGCNFETNTANFTTACISIAAGAAVGLNIHDNFIKGSIGILINGSATNVGGSFLIDNNIIQAANACITDSSDVAIVTRNMLISALANSTITNVITSNVKLAAGNIVTGDTDTQTHPFALIT